MYNETALPELTIIDSKPVAPSQTPEAVNQLLARLSQASNEASDSQSLVEEVRNATYQMVGFGPMFKALQRMAS